MTESTIKFDQPEKIKGQDNKTGESKYNIETIRAEEKYWMYLLKLKKKNFNFVFGVVFTKMYLYLIFILVLIWFIIFV